MHKYENDCVDCQDRFPCVGDSCPLKHALHFYCDRCGEECEKLYYWDSEELCLDCIEKELEVVEGSDDY